MLHCTFKNVLQNISHLTTIERKTKTTSWNVRKSSLEESFWISDYHNPNRYVRPYNISQHSKIGICKVLIFKVKFLFSSFFSHIVLKVYSHQLWKYWNEMFDIGKRECELKYKEVSFDYCIIWLELDFTLSVTPLHP